MNHESRHALGLLLVAGLIGGFAVGAWAAGWGPFRREPLPVPELGPDSPPRVAAAGTGADRALTAAGGRCHAPGRG